MKNLLYFSAIIFSVMFFSCTKEGPAGPQGPAGTNGTNGTNGNDGVANIQTFTFTTSSTSWTYYTAGKYYWCAATINEITPEVLSNGVVLAFEGDGTGDLWVGLPRTVSLAFTDYIYYLGGAEIHVGLTDSSTPGNPAVHQYKIVVIPPAQKLAHPGFDWSNYGAIRSEFNLKD